MVADGGVLNWRNWTFPVSPLIEASTKPGKVDGSYTGDTSDHPPTIEMPYEQRNPLKYPNLSNKWQMHQHFITPYLKNYFTDVGALINNGAGHKCEKFEVQAMECMEYYGVGQGVDACKDWYDDLMECRTMTKQRLRVRHMYIQRHFKNHLEYLQGKRTWEETYEEPPKFNSYLNPWEDPRQQTRFKGPLS